MIKENIAFIGGGNMATSMIGGLIDRVLPATQLSVTDIDAKKQQALSERYNIQTHRNNTATTQWADIIILAVKPNQMATVIAEIAPILQPQQLLISIAAGLRLSTLKTWGLTNNPIIRVMPNIAASVRASINVMVANPHVSSAQQEIASELTNSIGSALWLTDEDMLDAVTAISGSGPAYFFMLMEAMEDTAKQLGLSAEVANRLTIETAMGAATIAQKSQQPLNHLRQQVTSPNGTTEAALKYLNQAGVPNSLQLAIHRAYQRAQEMSKNL